MRVRKYKAWLMYHGVFVDVNSVDFNDGIIYYENIQEDSILDTEPKSVTDPIVYAESPEFDLIEWIGEVDMNGIEIYEDDVLECNFERFTKDEKVIVYKVVFRDAMFVIQGFVDGKEVKSSWRNFAKWKVVGNVLEDPELLEVEDVEVE